MPSSQPPPPTELIYVPGPSWVPAITALGLTLLAVGLFTLWVYSVVGAALALLALRSWIGRTRRDVSRLPREQRPATAVLPVVPARRGPRP
jgi:hypothetical protein